MAFNSVLRRASKSFLPLAIRAVGSPRTFHRAIPAVLSVENLRDFLPSSHFSTAATALKPTGDENLIRVLATEIECAEEPHDVEDISNEFPFKIKDNPGERTILLSRKFQDETIKIEVDMPSISDDDDDDNDDDDDAKDADVSSIPLVVSITKGSGQYMEFCITAFLDEISIDSLSIKTLENSDELAYEGPDFNDLDENLQNAFLKYLEIRGIKPSVTNVLFDYMANKDTKEYLLWLKNVKNFVEK